MILFRSLPNGKQQLVEKAVNDVELVLDSTDSSAPVDISDVVEAIISTVANNYATDNIRRISALHKKSCWCFHKRSEPI